MEILPINRENGGLTQLQPNPTDPATVQVSRIDKNPFASISGNTGTFDLNNPTASAPMSAQEYAGLLSRFNLSPLPETPANITQARSDVLGAYQPTQQETQYQTQANDLQSQLDKLNVQEKAGTGQIQEMPASSRFADTQMRQFQLGMSRQKGDVLSQIETAQRGLGYETAKRQGILQRATAALGFAQSDYENQTKRIDQMSQNNMDIMGKVVTYAQGLQDNQRQALSTIAKNFENSSQTFDQMTPQGQQGVMNLAKQWNIDPQAVIATINSQAHNNLLKEQKDAFNQQKTLLEMEKIKKEMNLPPKLDTSIVDANNRRLLVNNQTGEVIKDLGVSVLPKAKELAPDETKTINNFNNDLGRLKKGETREILITRLIAKYGDKINNDDIARKVYEIYSDATAKEIQGGGGGGFQ